MRNCPICISKLVGLTNDITYCDSCGYIRINNEKKILKDDLILQNGISGEEFNKKNITCVECVPYINKYCKRLMYVNIALLLLSIYTMIYTKIH